MISRSLEWIYYPTDWSDYEDAMEGVEPETFVTLPTKLQSTLLHFEMKASQSKICCHLGPIEANEKDSLAENVYTILQH